MIRLQHGTDSEYRALAERYRTELPKHTFVLDKKLRRSNANQKLEEFLRWGEHENLLRRRLIADNKGETIYSVEFGF
jgi:hypothetical protein